MSKGLPLRQAFAHLYLFIFDCVQFLTVESFLQDILFGYSNQEKFKRGKEEREIYRVKLRERVALSHI